MVGKEFKVGGLTVIVSDKMVEPGPHIVKKNPWWVWLFTGERTKIVKTTVPMKGCYVAGATVFVHPVAFEALKKDLKS